MATSSDDMKKDLTYRRYEEGDNEWGSMTDMIFKEDTSYKCPTYVHRTPPCQGSCPSGEDIRGWLDIVRGIEKPEEDMAWQEYAFRRSTNANPFPSIMGRVCPAPCQDGCNRNEVEDFVGINSVEQFIGDTALENKYTFDDAPADTGKKIAIIGGGPAGLAGAYQLRRMGHACTVFDNHEELGGFMRYGIPGYRTPRDVLDGEIQRIIDLGVEVKTSTKIGEDITVEQLEKDYDAILWAVGTHSGKIAPVTGGDASNSISGIDFLSAFNEGRLKAVTGNIVVIGGGDTSIDVASVARRLGAITNINEKDRPENVVMGHTAHDVASTAAREGANVTLTSLFPVENMTATEHEVQDAQHEGVTILGSVMPVEAIKGDDGRITKVKYAKCEMDGNRPVAIEGTEFEVDCDLLVSAIGQNGALDNLDMDNGHGFIDADKNYGVPGKPGHFVAGDIVRPHLLTTAIGQASIAAESINHYLNHEELSNRPKVDVHHYDLLQKLRETGLEPTNYDSSGDQRGTDSTDFAIHNFEDRSANEIIKSTQLFLGHFEYEERNIRKDIPVDPENIIGSFRERMEGLSEENAQAEASRCMSCGMCFECDNCVIYCPQTAVKRTPKKDATTGRYVYTDYDLCVGCHICADVCPTGYIDMGMGE
ncbi:MAG: NAD(P)-binding protein [Gammaproteobacteria bacterium]|nr:NAD(P)-binding protein [Gammaproteobacteria bacterium]